MVHDFEYNEFIGYDQSATIDEDTIFIREYDKNQPSYSGDVVQVTREDLEEAQRLTAQQSDLPNTPFRTDAIDFPWEEYDHCTYKLPSGVFVLVQNDHVTFIEDGKEPEWLSLMYEQLNELVLLAA